MKKAKGLWVIFALGLLIPLLVGAQSARADSQVITINSNGDITPSNAPIQREKSIYTITSNLYNSSITIERGNIVINGANHTLQGPGSSQNLIAVTLMASNVTVNNFRISGWKAGVYGAYNNNTITNNVFTDNNQGITVYANNYVVSENSISGSDTAILVCSGVLQPQGDNNLITRNQITNNNWALDIVNSNGTIITENNITENKVILTLGTQQANIHLAGVHMLYLNNFINNQKVLHIPFGGPFASAAVPVSPAGQWDNSTAGNYWGDYSSKYPNASEIGHLRIGDTPYLIEDSVTWSRDYANGTHLEGIAILGTAIDCYPLMAPHNISNSNTLSPYPSSIQSASPTPSPTPSPPIAPAQSQSATPSPTITLTPSSPSIPEVPTWMILSLTAITMLIAAIIIKRKKLKE
jgi:parallel beta-helix repeat protein